MNNNYPFLTIAQARKTRTMATVEAAPQPELKLWETETFQLTAASAVFAIFLIWASLNKKQPQLTSARMANRWDKLNATKLAFIYRLRLVASAIPVLVGAARLNISTNFWD